MHSTDNSQVDDVSTTMIIDHLVIRDRATGEIIVNRRGNVVEKAISEINFDADHDETDD